jgi:hypothetical protein
MRSWNTLACALAVAAITPVPGPVWAGEDGDLARQLRSAVQPLLSPSPGDASGTRSLVEILGIATRAAERADLPSGVVAKLGEAHAAWRRSPQEMPNAGVTAALGEAHAALHGGRRFAFPSSVRTIDQARGLPAGSTSGGGPRGGPAREATRGCSSSSCHDPDGGTLTPGERGRR